MDPQPEMRAPVDDASSLRADRRLAFAAIMLASLHAAYHIGRGHAGEMLWMCNASVVLLAVGLTTRADRVIGVGTLWILVGLPLWLDHVLSGRGVLLPTSILSHVGGFVIALLSTRRRGLAKGSWWRAGAAMVAVWVVARLITSPVDNVNLAFRIWPGWERYSTSFPLYLAGSGSTVVLAFVLFEWTARKLWPRTQAA